MWEYDGSIHRFPVKPGARWECQLGTLMCNDLYRGLPDFMRADLVFVDPPWNSSNENAFRTKAGLRHQTAGYATFLNMLFQRLDTIAPTTIFFEIGAQSRGEIAFRLSQRFGSLNIYPATYYNKSPCFIVRASQAEPTVDYSGLDEMVVIDRICTSEPFDVIADPCMGRGAVATAAFRHGRRFVGTEMSPARLAVTIAKIHGIGGVWHVDGTRFEPQPGSQRDLGAGREGAGE